jgi:hypothetical protein
MKVNRERYRVTAHGLETLYNALHLYRSFANIRGKSVPLQKGGQPPQKTYNNRFINARYINPHKTPYKRMSRH